MKQEHQPSDLEKKRRDTIDDDIPTLEEPIGRSKHVQDEDADLTDMSLDDTNFTVDDDHTPMSEMEEIHTLQLDNMVDEDQLDPTSREFEIATLEAIVFDGAAPKSSAKSSPAKTEAPTPPTTATVPPSVSPTTNTAPNVPPTVLVPPATSPGAKPLPKTSNNPFLPQHILDRLNQGKRNLVEEIAQSGAALDASTAILRTRARADRLQKSLYSEPKTHDAQPRDRTHLRQQQLIDELVEEYLPLLAAELRKRLKRILDENHS